MIQQANRLDHVQEYYFSTKLQEVRNLSASGKDIINLGIGSPDLPPPKEVLDGLNFALTNPAAHQYQPYKGTVDFRNAIKEFYKTHYRVDLDAETEILPLMGSKEGITHISMAFLNEGDEVLIPNPGYPTYTSVTKLVGAKAVYYDLNEEENWSPNLQELAKRDLSKVKLMWVNYPHMPTGASATDKIFKDLVTFAKEHNILIINDNPYSFILNDHPKSILESEDAREVVLELNSLSKSFNMAGWRIGMLCGSAKNLNTVLKVKTNMDSGMFYPLQAGAAAALRLPVDWFNAQNEIYTSRKEKILQLADVLECKPAKEQTGLFVWARVPKGDTSEGFVNRLLYEQSIFTAPGFIFGSQGEGYVRFSLCATDENINRAIKRII
ncbi:aminotransferase class I/II-fold pyridoxal phosphate-dependent enzyme [Antarcticibacterium flavum]|uniref:Aminotransferase n=1 Tax=Antarcticibacterium flavum TaxID=2058175 RepID=A0A5B7WZY3_9FLAO|nr:MULTISPECIES: aminotransferase class I/II-fold pyridoxal phosphate-dependent enzyme [Antarcticibacterium]MCM4159894.1 aminotransferase [Antarcticibacterium sp. W02-3]QCY68894.1 aminotransferase class I/II-fold pyridoxal phosphate-dependent enzyme [Antarcticibacterium flavum]